MDLRILFLLFIIYSFLGWLMEVAYVSIKNKKVVDRGFLIGPICPIYGTGALLIINLLDKYENDIIALFVMATLVGIVLEYLTSYIMEKLFKTRWWDYSDKSFNLNGRICLEDSLCFGLLGVLLIHFIDPFFINVLTNIPDILITITTIIMVIIFITDTTISFKIISKIKKTGLNEHTDETEEITRRVKEILIEHSKLTKRLVTAFPNLKIKINTDIKKIKQKIER